MVFTKSTKIVLVVSILTVAALIKFLPKSVTDYYQSKPVDLTEDVKKAISTDLKKTPGFVKLHKLEILSPALNEQGKVTVSYHISYDSNTENEGTVTHDFDATAMMEQRLGEWKISMVRPDSQTLIFNNPLLIKNKKPLSGSAPAASTAPASLAPTETSEAPESH